MIHQIIYYFTEKLRNNLLEIERNGKFGNNDFLPRGDEAVGSDEED